MKLLKPFPYPSKFCRWQSATSHQNVVDSFHWPRLTFRNICQWQCQESATFGTCVWLSQFKGILQTKSLLTLMSNQEKGQISNYLLNSCKVSFYRRLLRPTHPHQHNGREHFKIWTQSCLVLRLNPVKLCLTWLLILWCIFFPVWCVFSFSGRRPLLSKR